MAQLTSSAQLKENAALLDAIRHQYADGDDVRVARLTENALKETTKASQKANADAKDLIQSTLI